MRKAGVAALAVVVLSVGGCSQEALESVKARLTEWDQRIQASLNGGDASGPDGGQTAPSEPISLYDRMSAQDIGLAVGTVQTALETVPDNDSAKWHNAASGNSGRVEPRRTYMTSGGYFCREYEESLVVEGQSATHRNTACRDDDGYWTWID